MEAQKYFKVRYAETIKVPCSHQMGGNRQSVNENIGKYKWILREKFTAVVVGRKKDLDMSIIVVSLSKSNVNQ